MSIQINIQMRPQARRLLGPRMLLPIVLTLMMLSQQSSSEAVAFTNQNFDALVGSKDLAFVNFYADWCRFSGMLAPIWSDAADRVTDKLGDRVIVGKVDCDSQADLAARFHITKYPTLRLLRNGHPAKKEYRGERSPDAFVRFLEAELADPVRVISGPEELQENKTGQVIGYFESAQSSNYLSFLKMAGAVKDDCHVLAGFGEPFGHLRAGGQDSVVVRKAGSDQLVSLPHLDITNTQKLIDWTLRTCVPLVREITFENAEALTEERRPFLILFHLPEDKETPRRFRDFVERELFDEKDGVNFLTADGIKFAHPLAHLSKAKEDLPLIAIDSFRHMYLFDDIKEMETPGRLKDFIADLHSGKLHREFHYGKEAPKPAAAAAGPTEPTSPPESVFQKLQPSDHRYTLLKDEL